MLQQIRTPAELHREYARILDLAETYKISHLELAKNGGSTGCTFFDFRGDPKCFSFAQAVVEGKAVFPGHHLYDNEGNSHIIQDFPSVKGDLVVTSHGCNHVSVSTLTWVKPVPKPTFKRGEPCMVRDIDDQAWSLRLHSGNHGNTIRVGNAEDFITGRLKYNPPQTAWNQVRKLTQAELDEYDQRVNSWREGYVVQPE